MLLSLFLNLWSQFLCPERRCFWPQHCSCFLSRSLAGLLYSVEERWWWRIESGPPHLWACKSLPCFGLFWINAWRFLRHFHADLSYLNIGILLRHWRQQCACRGVPAETGSPLLTCHVEAFRKCTATRCDCLPKEHLGVCAPFDRTGNLYSPNRLCGGF